MTLSQLQAETCQVLSRLQILIQEASSNSGGLLCPTPSRPALRLPGRDGLPGLAERLPPSRTGLVRPLRGVPGSPRPEPCRVPAGARPGWGAMATWRRDGRLTSSQRLLCAGLAGTLSLSLTAPLELASVLAQVGVVRGPGRGPWAAGLGVWRAEGPRALWKGNAVACLRLFPYSAVQLAAYRK